MFTILLGLFGISLFVFGYYLGNQIGRTEHIRNRLNEATSTSLHIHEQ